jgi:SAM-dependent methyltransferase
MKPKYETRTLPELRQHYDVETRLARHLLSARSTERRVLYSSVYDELLRSVPLHPHHTRKADPRQSAEENEDKMMLLERFLKPATTLLEIGAGNCAMSLMAARMVKKVFALEVSHEVVKNVVPPPNLEIVISDGCSVPVPPGTIDVAYSYQVMEHIHPDDALDQLRNVFTALARGGVYLCLTPNRASGPHDISQYFDSVAHGFHLKEYGWGELARLFRSVGFSKVEAYVGFKNRYARVPLWLPRLVEAVVWRLPERIRRPAGNARGIRNLLFITAAGIK